MTKEFTKNQIKRLGERLRSGNADGSDLRLLDLYRRSFIEAYELVVETIRRELALEPTGRSAKSNISIYNKLRRQRISLPRIQDIAGCRLIVSGIASQDQVVQALDRLFEEANIVDRRQQPSHGYRAVHVIVKCLGKVIEIQVRTELQDLWAELSEKLSDVLDPSIKYGGGDKPVRDILTYASFTITIEELLETLFTDMQAQLSSQDRLTGDDKQQIDDIQQRLSSIYQVKLSSMRQQIFDELRGTIEDVEKLKGE